MEGNGSVFRDRKPHKTRQENAKETIKYEIEEDIQDKNSDDDKIDTIDIVHHKIEI